MSSSRARGAEERLATLAFDPGRTPLLEPRLLLDGSFLAALQQELEQELGAEEAARSLLQMGCLHGLRDAQRVLGGIFGAPSGQAVPPTASPLPLRLRGNPRAEPRGAIELSGTWPGSTEAAARLSHHAAGGACACWLSAGYTSGWLSGIFDAEILAVETSCAAAGDPACGFVAREQAAWRREPAAKRPSLLGALPFDVLRELAGRSAGGEPSAEVRGGEAGVVHIWGPVMVVPFTTPEEAMMAVDLVELDRGAAQVSVLVVDLTGVCVDESYGAVALEHIVEAAEEWGLEVVIGGVSSISEPVVAGLDRPPILVEKDLHAAIAAGFRIANAQRQLL